MRLVLWYISLTSFGLGCFAGGSTALAVGLVPVGAGLMAGAAFCAVAVVSTFAYLQPHRRRGAGHVRINIEPPGSVGVH